jgi:hypothetical protein
MTERKEIIWIKKFFISYVHENREAVRSVVDKLIEHGAEVWIDEDHLKAGARWKNVIKKRISDGAYFIAFFSDEYTKKEKTYMNEEIISAVEKLRLRPADKTWFIPVMLSNCQIPDFNIGAGETLRDLQCVRMYEDWEKGVGQLLSAIVEFSHFSSKKLTRFSIRLERAR